jgi:hypothetical protein
LIIVRKTHFVCYTYASEFLSYRANGAALHMEVAVTMFRFKTLWDNHPTIKGDAPIVDKATYHNQCAINLSAALMRTGIAMDDFHGVLSWQKDKPKYAIRAQELADWLAFKSRFLGRSRIKVSAPNFNKQLSQKSGIIFFKNYWGAGRQGDHLTYGMGRGLLTGRAGRA